MNSFKIILLLLLCGFTAKLNSQTITSNSPISVDAVLNTEFEVYVSVENVIDLFGISFNLAFNQNYINAISVTQESFLGSDVVFFPNMDNTNGIVSTGISRKFGQGNVSGSGNLVKIKFQVVTLPLFDVSLEFDLADIQANDDQGKTVVLAPQNSTTILNLNDPPVVSDIPNQTIPEGSSFATIQLDDYVTDPDNLDNEITWTYSGNTDLIVTISGTRIATIEIPNENWYGSETIIFTATDLAEAKDSVIVVFTVNNINDPPMFLDNMLKSITFKQDTIFTFNILEYVSDNDTPDSSLIFDFTPNNDSVLVEFIKTTGNCTLSSLSNYFGEVELKVVMEDDSSARAEAIISIKVDDVTGIDDFLGNGPPKAFTLYQNYPNPFNPSSKITYAVPEGTKVKIVIYDILGVEVLDLVDEYHSPGVYTVTLNANNLSTGIYIYRMIADSFVETKKLMLLK